MTDKFNTGSRYSSPETNSSQEPHPLGAGYSILLALNAVGLILGLLLIPIEISGDSYAPIIAYLVGGPLLVFELLFAAIPAWIYVTRFRIAQTIPLLVLSIVAALVPAIGLLLAWNLRTTHGSGC